MSSFVSSFKKIKNNFYLVKLLIRKLGFTGAMKAATEDVLFDYKNGIDTLSAIPTKDLGLEDEAKIDQCSRYVPSFASCVRDILDRVQKDIDFNAGNFVDMGSGKGKVLFIATKYDFKKIIGVEYSKDLHDICEINIKKIGAEERILSIHEDGSKYEPNADNNIYYFFNPFTGDLLDSCLKNLLCNDMPFKGRLVYAIPYDSHIFDKYADEIDDFRTGNGVHVKIYKAKDNDKDT